MTYPTVRFYDRDQHYAAAGTGDSHLLSLTGRLAFDLVKHFGVIAGRPNGEDKAGRSVLDLQPPEQVVTRACEIAELFVAAAETKGWLFEVPMPVVDEEEQAEKLARATARAKALKDRLAGEQPGHPT